MMTLRASLVDLTGKILQVFVARRSDCKVQPWGDQSLHDNSGNVGREERSDLRTVQGTASRFRHAPNMKAQIK